MASTLGRAAFWLVAFFWTSCVEAVWQDCGGHKMSFAENPYDTGVSKCLIEEDPLKKILQDNTNQYSANFMNFTGNCMTKLLQKKFDPYPWIRDQEKDYIPGPGDDNWEKWSECFVHHGAESFCRTSRKNFVGTMQAYYTVCVITGCLAGATAVMIGAALVSNMGDKQQDASIQKAAEVAAFVIGATGASACGCGLLAQCCRCIVWSNKETLVGDVTKVALDCVDIAKQQTGTIVKKTLKAEFSDNARLFLSRADFDKFESTFNDNSEQHVEATEYFEMTSTFNDKSSQHATVIDNSKNGNVVDNSKKVMTDQSQTNVALRSPGAQLQSQYKMCEGSSNEGSGSAVCCAAKAGVVCCSAAAESHGSSSTSVACPAKFPYIQSKIEDDAPGFLSQTLTAQPLLMAASFLGMICLIMLRVIRKKQHKKLNDDSDETDDEQGKHLPAD